MARRAALEQRLGVGGVQRQLCHPTAVGRERAVALQCAEREQLLERRRERVGRRRRDKIKREDVLDAERLQRQQRAREANTLDLRRRALGEAVESRLAVEPVALAWYALTRARAHS